LIVLCRNAHKPLNVAWSGKEQFLKMVNDFGLLLVFGACWLAWPAVSAVGGGCINDRGIPSQTLTGLSQPERFYASAASATDSSAGMPGPDRRPPPKMSGGPCEYKTYTGYAEIISIRLEKLTKGASGPPYESHKVKFLFFPNQPVEEAYAQVDGKPQQLNLTNSWYPGPRFLEKYGIEEGKTFDCYLNVITRGVCTPVVFAFPDINLSDYFEIELLK
jgi:hypothetical protein